LVFFLSDSGPFEEGRLEKKESGKPPDPLQRLHDTARLLRAHDLAPLFKAAASRPEEGERLHGEADISSATPDVKMPSFVLLPRGYAGEVAEGRRGSCAVVEPPTPPSSYDDDTSPETREEKRVRLDRSQSESAREPISRPS
jgi:hypothetical protein